MRRSLGPVASILNEAAERTRLNRVYHERPAPCYLRVEGGCIAVNWAAMATHSATALASHKNCALSEFARSAGIFFGADRLQTYWWHILDARRTYALKHAALQCVGGYYA